jgi:hypothetical protein
MPGATNSALHLDLSAHHCRGFSPPDREPFSTGSGGAKGADPGFGEDRHMATDIRSIVEEFVNQVVAAVEADSVARVQQAVVAAFGDGAVAPRRAGGSGRTPREGVAPAPARQRPKQFCPVPGCSGVAAPVFGMVCAQHKDMSKAKIKEYRAQRRAAKAGKN